MSQQADIADNSREKFHQWCFQETVELERKKKDLDEERREFEEEQKSFERKQRELRSKQEIEDHRLAQKEKLLEMKQQILEAELRKLAGEKEEFEREKHYYEQEHRRSERRTYQEPSNGYSASAVLFFKGVGNELALKKRYKDLIKIYHPDNVAGDTYTLQEINREYEKMKKAII